MIEPIEITGIREALRELDRIEPGLRKKFAKEARSILQPAVTEIRQAYPATLLRGAERQWSGGESNKAKNRQIFPYSQQRARRGVSVAATFGGRKRSVIRIVQKDPAAIVAEFAGARSPSPLAQALSFKYGRPGRFVWPAMERKKDEVQDNMKRATMNIVARANRNLR